jgi:tetratricopeptide (TPR) repeat protein
MVLKQVLALAVSVLLTGCTAQRDLSGPEELALAQKLRKSGDLKGAEKHSKLAVALYERAFGTGSLQVTEPLELLISSSCAQGQCADTEDYWRRMLVLREKHLGKNDAKTIATVCQLGEICEQKHKYAEAKSLYLRALSVREADKSFLVSPTLIALARLESSQGSQSAARNYLKRAETIENTNASPVNLRAQIAAMKQRLGGAQVK